MSLKQAQDFFHSVVPFPPGWWQFKQALFDTSIEADRIKLLQTGLEKNLQWKKDKFNSHPWSIKQADGKYSNIDPKVILELYEEQA